MLPFNVHVLLNSPKTHAHSIVPIYRIPELIFCYILRAAKHSSVYLAAKLSRPFASAQHLLSVLAKLSGGTYYGLALSLDILQAIFEYGLPTKMDNIYSVHFVQNAISIQFSAHLCRIYTIQFNFFSSFLLACDSFTCVFIFLYIFCCSFIRSFYITSP